MNGIELRHCPFCGGKAAVNYNCGQFAVECPDCECSTAFDPSKEKVVAAWNRRPQDGHKCGECAELCGNGKTTLCTHVRELVGTSDEACELFEPKSERSDKNENS